MHLGNGAVTPECAVITLGVAVVGAGCAGVALRRAGWDRWQWLSAAALGTLVFAAQMVNVQVLPYSSVHLIGGVLLAWILGPAAGLLAMALVLLLQAALLGDGGTLALGANFINMGLIPAGLVAIARMGPPAGANARRNAITIMLICFAATVAAAVSIVGEVALGRTLAELAGLRSFASQMIWTHMLAGALEGIVTVALVAAFGMLSVEPPLAEGWPPHRVAYVLAASVVIVVLSTAGMASTAPDFYESAAQALGALEV